MSAPATPDRRLLLTASCESDACPVQRFTIDGRLPELRAHVRRLLCPVCGTVEVALQDFDTAEASR